MALAIVRLVKWEELIPDHLELHSGDASKVHIFTLYFLDSGSYQQKRLPWVDADYDYIKQYVLSPCLADIRSQIDWFLNTSASISPIERPFQPDGATDLGHIWRRSPSRLPRVEKTLAKPNAMMWFHIPLPEAYDTPDTDSSEILQVGTHDDGKGASKTNSGFFYNGIKEAFEAVPGGDGMELPVSEVKVLGHGHTHNTDMCKRVNGIW